MKKLFALLLAALLLCTACTGAAASSQSADTAVSSVTAAGTLANRYVAPGTENVITLAQTTASFNGQNGVSVSGATVTITKAGTYTVQGSFTDGQLVVDTTDDGVVNLVLNGASITSTTGAALLVYNADETVISIANDTQNTLADAAEYADSEDEATACLYSKDDLWLCGGGTLTVNANHNNGIQSKDTLTLAAGNYTVTSVDDALVGKDSVTMGDGVYTLIASGDGIKATNAEDAALGTVTLYSGTFTITAENDAVQAQTLLTVQGGTYNITTGGGAQNAAAKTQNEIFGMGGGGRGQWANAAAGEQAGTELPAAVGNGMTPPDGIDANATATMGGEVDATASATISEPSGQGHGAPPTGDVQMPTDTAAPVQSNTVTQTTEDTASIKGFKGGTAVIITGGEFTMDTCDDAVHSNGTVTVSGGTFTIATGDDAFHADTILDISGGTVTVTQSYEGLEGHIIRISGGTLNVTASDDGVNVVGGDGSGQFGFAQDNTSATEESILAGDTYLYISGGTLTVTADGDGIDINGSGAMDGGTVTVYGPTSGGDGALDYDGTFLVNGGSLVCFGAQQMAMAPSAAGTQPCLSVYGSMAAGTLISVKDAEGNTVYSITTPKEAQHMALCAAELSVGTQYTVYADDTELGSVTLAAGVNTIGGGTGMGG